MDWNFRAGDEVAPGRRATALLGGGERYEAYLAWDERLLSPTVMKILRPDRVDDDRARRSIAAEAALLRELDHPSFIRLFDADLDGPRPYIELEYLDGPRLSTLLRRHGVLIPEQLFPLARQLAAALHYLHRRGIVHLDVKPRNIIMGPTPRLIDLSVARRLDQVAAIRGPIGTDAYMAPEQCDPERYQAVGAAADSWGVGVTLYEAATKRLPFPRGDHQADGAARWPQLAMDPIPPPSKVPPDLAELLMACLAPDPSARPSQLELFEAFDALAGRYGVARVRTR